ncbi:hypothetical protein AGOR_G00081970 [Albula goreensis]|uniref:Uncharacterized protein n=1 Tax=Albula goreensis TaxID=1534307 RepID=A0A8T3DPT9_9TELE|nr:hypothetical protein AGOR_G00081970 [Albula goreensis]
MSNGTDRPAADELDQELDLLLTLQTSVAPHFTDSSPSTHMPEEEVGQPDTSILPEEEPQATPAEAEAVKPEVTEDDLEDWLDSMIS